MKKPKITEGEWSLILEGEIPQLGVRNGQIIIPVISKLPFETEAQRANAQAIVKAVNNTYHSGIDPEAVPEVRQQLSKAVGTIETIIDLYALGENQTEELLTRIKEGNEALIKAELNLNENPE